MRVRPNRIFWSCFGAIQVGRGCRSTGRRHLAVPTPRESFSPEFQLAAAVEATAPARHNRSHLSIFRVGDKIPDRVSLLFFPGGDGQTTNRSHSLEATARRKKHQRTQHNAMTPDTVAPDVLSNLGHGLVETVVTVTVVVNFFTTTQGDK